MEQPGTTFVRPAVVSAFAGVLAYSAFAQGGYYLRQGIAVAAGFAVVAFAARASRERAAPALPSLIAFGLLFGALAVSAAAASWPADMWRPVLTLSAAAAAFAGTRALVRGGGSDRLLSATVWIATGIAALGVFGVAFHAFPWAMRAQGLWRASSTLTYANAAGAFLTLALPAVLILRARHDSALHRLQVFVITLCLVVTLSRGAAIGVIVLTIALMATGGRRLLGGMIRPAMGAAAAAVAMFPSIASWWPRPIHATVGIIAGALVASVPLTAGRTFKRAAGAVLILGMVGGAFTAVAASERPAQFIASRLGGSSDDRTIFWRASLHAAVQHPVLGTGPGTYRGFIQDRGRELMVFYVHNEYLQIFAETGAVGLLAVLAAIAIFAGWAWRRRPARGSPSRAVWAAGISACAAFCAHGFFDFMWRLPVIVVLAFIWLAMALDAKERGIEC